MNTKKKHKNRPKTTPNQPQKVETENKEKKLEDVLPKSDVEEEIPVTTGVAVDEETTLVVENLETLSDTPKKPKRNKGKKKNQGKESIEEDTQEKGQVNIHCDASETEHVLNEGDGKKQDENKSSEATSITPSARKKKNKNKPQELPSEQLNVSEKECLTVVPEEKQTEIMKLDGEINDSLPEKIEETKPETKAKKKNKKKKRTDSEKSDKSEEVTCTSAFQQLLIEDDKQLEKIKIGIEDASKTCLAAIVTTESAVLDEVPKSWDIETPSKETFKEENENKKKNKKVKKHSPEEQQKVDKLAEPIKIRSEIKSVMDLIDPFKSQIVKELSPKLISEAMPKVKQETESLEPLKPQGEREPSPKPKAKIAKPVEKKRKGEQDLENLSKSTENLTFMKEEIETPNRTQTPIETTEQQKPEKLVPSITQESIPPMVDTVNVPDSKTKDKKRKMLPNPLKMEEKIQVREELSQVIMTPKIEQVLTDEKPDKPKNIKEKITSGMENVMFTMFDEPFIPLQKSEKIDEVPPLIQIDETNVPDNKTGKKKKKTPKFPVSTEITAAKEIKQLITPEATEAREISKTEEPFRPENVTDTGVASATPLSDIEIKSVKTDDVDLSCDATPDVHFIRSSSHRILDSNNNTIIHELRNVQEAKPNEPFDMPIVEGSGETPSGTPDLEASGIQQAESKTMEKEEPTYLKSKMMEVNQDMEELRLSIERSLAEFSAMEESEEKAEKDYESHRIECERAFAEVEVPKSDVKVTPEIQMTVPVDLEKNTAELPSMAEVPPVCPARKDNKGKSKSKKKGKLEATPVASTASTQSTTTTSSESKDTKNKQEKTEQKTESTENKGKQQSQSSDKKGKQQSDIIEPDSSTETQTTEISEDSNKNSTLEKTYSDSLEQLDLAPIENFEDALTSSIDDVNKSFEMIASDNAEESQKKLSVNKPEINITAPAEDTKSNEKDKNKKDDKINPVSQPKNFLGHNDIPAQSSRTDYKKEKNKIPNERQAKVKIKDSMEVEAKKQSKESQTDIKRTKKLQEKSEKETFSRVKNDNEEYVYKYSFRKVFLQSACHTCHKDLLQMRVPCSYCYLVFYCGAKHKDEDWAQHQALCFAVSTIVHLKDQKHIYADAQNVNGQDYRLLRMQMIVSCEKVLKRRLVPWEQEAMLYPRMCGDASCREWRQSKLKDCEGCGQISYCADQPSHLPKSHQRWCKSYHLYSKLVSYQQTRGRLEPTLPTRVMENSHLAEKMNEVLAAMYEEKIDMNDIQYAALTQLATAPLTAAHCYQMCKSKMNYSNGVHKQKTSFTIHVVGAELQFEADALNKWEVFFLHLRPDVDELKVVLISPVLNPGDLPLDLLGKIRLCDKCHQYKRRVVFSFQDKKNYSEYRASEEFISPDLVCAFNPSVQRSSVYNGKDPWPNTINCVIKQKVPFIITGYTLTELRKDIARIKECSEVDFRVISEPVFNNFASVRPDRNFISDDEMPLLFKNYCVSVLGGC